MDLGCGGFFILSLSQVCVLVDIHDHVGDVTDGKAGIGTGKAVFMEIQSIDFYLSGDAQADDGINDLEDDEHDDQNIGVDGQDSQGLDAQESGAAPHRRGPS